MVTGSHFNRSDIFMGRNDEKATTGGEADLEISPWLKTGPIT